MRLHYYIAKEGNFGDDLNSWIWEDILPSRWNPDSPLSFSGIGTILGRSMPASPQWIVFTSGTGYEPPPADFGGPDWHVLAVRGPLSARVLNLGPEAAVTDGAILLSHLQRFAPLPEAEREGVVFIPHHSALAAGRWQEVAARAGVQFVDPRSESRLVIDRIRQARLVLADSMHAAIVADSVRVPWLPVITSPSINSFKWLDWAMSMEMPYEPVLLPASSAAEAWRARTYGLRGPTYNLLGASVEEIIEGYRALQRAAPPTRLRRLQRRWVSERVQYALQDRGLRRTLTSLDAPHLEAAAKTMSELSGKTGYLSDDRVFRARSAELRSRLTQVTALADRYERARGA